MNDETATLQEVMQLLRSILQRLDRFEAVFSKYEPTLQRYSGWRKGNAGKQR